jgi:hypothetical protein
MSTARAFVKPTASSVGMHAAKCSAVRSGAAAVSMPAFRSSGVAAFRGFVGISAAPVVSGFAASQRAAFHVSAVDEDEASVEVSDEAPAAGPVKLYVGNLSWGVDDVTLEEVFGDFQASDMTVVSDMNTGRSRGFGFVTVPSQEEAEKCIAALDGSVSGGAQISPLITSPPIGCGYRKTKCLGVRVLFSFFLSHPLAPGGVTATERRGEQYVYTHARAHRCVIHTQRYALISLCFSKQSH